MTMTWKNGRQLSTLHQGSNSISYAYDPNGLRYSKTVNGTQTIYNYDENGKLLSQTIGNETLWFIYDGDGNPVGFNYISGSTFDTFYYITDLQGDITGMTDRYGGYCVTYNYDQWGKLLSQSGTTSWAQKMMNLNPLRYRGYVYDSESGLYYLQSRYYDPTTCRFINADDICNTRPGLTDTNIFTYCQNNPVNMVDNNGEIPDWVITGAIHLAITNFWGFWGWAEYYAIKGFISVAGNVFLAHKKYAVAKALFNHGMWGYGSSISQSTKNLIIKSVKKAKEFTNKIAGMLKGVKSNSVNRSSTIEFLKGCSPDLYYGIQHANIKIKGNKVNGRWQLTVTISDKYDFDNLRLFSKISFGNAANDLGWAMQKIGMMTVYKWSVSFAYTY